MDCSLVKCASLRYAGISENGSLSAYKQKTAFTCRAHNVNGFLYMECFGSFMSSWLTGYGLLDVAIAEQERNALQLEHDRT